MFVEWLELKKRVCGLLTKAKIVQFDSIGSGRVLTA